MKVIYIVQQPICGSRKSVLNIFNLPEFPQLTYPPILIVIPLYFWYNNPRNHQYMDGMEPPRKLSREQKVGLTLLFVFSLLTVSLAFLQIRNTLVRPFVVRSKTESQQKSLKDFQVELQNIDTDQDSLNDYEELNFYQTSPYLPDTDSDGKLDKTEIDAGTDPLCAEGKNCQNAETLPERATTTPFIPPSPLSQLTGGLPLESNVEANKEIEVLVKNPEKIRALLRQSGRVTEEQLSKLDDATLVRMLQEIVSQSPKSNGAPQGAVTASTTVTSSAR